MPIFHVLRARTGPAWRRGVPLEEQSGWASHAAYMDDGVERGFILLGGPLEDERRVVLVVRADSAEEVHGELARDPWSGTHLETEDVDSWTIRLNGMGRAG
jgi:hypothetical protein